jgi:hypothetical protein
MLLKTKVQSKVLKKRKKPKNVKRLTRTVPPKKGPVPQGIDVPMNPKYYP